MARTVNPERRAQKKKEILEAAMQCFAVKGFHSTSMQDVCRTASMSPGALYRYFASKDDIITAIVEEECKQSDAFTLQISESGDLFGTLDEAIAQVIQESSEPGYAQLSAEVYAELSRNDQARAIASKGHTKATDALARAISQAMDSEEVNDTWDPDALAEVLITLIDTIDTRPAFTRKASDKSIHKTVIKLIELIKA